MKPFIILEERHSSEAHTLKAIFHFSQKYDYTVRSTGVITILCLTREFTHSDSRVKTILSILCLKSVTSEKRQKSAY